MKVLRASLLLLVWITLAAAQSTVTIYTANFQHGEGTDGVTDYSRQVTAVASADIVCVQEQNTSDTGWDTPMSNAGLTQAIFDSHLGSAGDGNAIWVRASTVTVLQTYSFDMVNGVNPTSGSAITGWDGVDVRRTLVAIKAQVGSRQFYVVNIHLVANSGEDSSSTNFASQRVDQINSALGWITSTLTGGLDVVIAGDLNTPVNYPRAPELTYTADSGTNVITSAAHGLTDGTPIVLRNSGGAQPSPLSVGDSLYAQATVYYVRDVTTDTFKLATTQGGTAIDLTTNGTGTNVAAATQWGLFTHGGYNDLWQEGIAGGVATASWGDRDADTVTDMPVSFQLTRTHDTRRIDYIMLKESATALTLSSISVPDNRATCGTALTLTGTYKECPAVTQLWDTPDDQGPRPSDHNYIAAVLTVGVTKCRFHTVPACQ